MAQIDQTNLDSGDDFPRLARAALNAIATWANMLMGYVTSTISTEELAAIRASLDVPKRDGTDATGTWDIAVENGVVTNTAQTITGRKTFSSSRASYSEDSSQAAVVSASGAAADFATLSYAILDGGYSVQSGYRLNGGSVHQIGWFKTNGDPVFVFDPTTAPTGLLAMQGDGVVSGSGVTTDQLVANIQGLVTGSSTGDLIASDAGRVCSGTANRTVPANVFSVGQVVTIDNTGGSTFTISPGAGLTLRKGGTALTGAVTVMAHGQVTLLFRSATLAVAAGHLQ